MTSLCNITIWFEKHEFHYSGSFLIPCLLIPIVERVWFSFYESILFKNYTDLRLHKDHGDSGTLYGSDTFVFEQRSFKTVGILKYTHLNIVPHIIPNVTAYYHISYGCFFFLRSCGFFLSRSLFLDFPSSCISPIPFSHTNFLRQFPKIVTFIPISFPTVSSLIFLATFKTIWRLFHLTCWERDLNFYISFFLLELLKNALFLSPHIAEITAITSAF